MAAIAKKHSLYASCVQTVRSFSSVYNMCIPEDQYNKRGKSPILFEASSCPRNSVSVQLQKQICVCRKETFVDNYLSQTNVLKTKKQTGTKKDTRLVCVRTERCHKEERGRRR